MRKNVQIVASKCETEIPIVCEQLTPCHPKTYVPNPRNDHVSRFSSRVEQGCCYNHGLWWNIPNRQPPAPGVLSYGKVGGDFCCRKRHSRLPLELSLETCLDTHCLSLAQRPECRPPLLLPSPYYQSHGTTGPPCIIGESWNPFNPQK
jgi:hypothetical protein